MDYTASTALDKPQWDLMHGEQRRLTWFQGEEEGMYEVFSSELTEDNVKLIKGIINDLKLESFIFNDIYTSIIDKGLERFTYCIYYPDRSEIYDGTMASLNSYEWGSISSLFTDSKYYSSISIRPEYLSDNTYRFALAEETFHSGQASMYGRTIGKYKNGNLGITINEEHWMIETEVKVYRAYSNLFDEKYMQLWYNQDPIVEKYFSALRSKLYISDELEKQFRDHLYILALDVCAFYTYGLIYSNLSIDVQRLVVNELKNFKDKGCPTPYFNEKAKLFIK